MSEIERQTTDWLAGVKDAVKKVAYSVGMNQGQYKSLITYELKDFISAILYTTQNKLIECIDRGELRALDQFGNEFIVKSWDRDNVVTDTELINDVICFKMDNPNIPFKDILILLGTKFSVIYNVLSVTSPIDIRFAKEGPKIVHIPLDICKYLVENNYGNDVFEHLLTNSFNRKIKYNFVEVLRKIIKIGKEFDNKSAVIKSDSKQPDGVVDYVIYKYNSWDISKLERQFKNSRSPKVVKELESKCVSLDISYNNVMYRYIMKKIPLNECITMGIDEREQYKIDHDFNSGIYIQVVIINFLIICFIN